MLNYYVVDTETTGLSVSFHEINQISIIRVSDGFQKSWNIAVENPKNASAEALKIQGITRADLKNGIPVAEAITAVDAFIAEDGLNEASRCFIGHNVSFDRRFMQAAWAKEKKKLMTDLWLCTRKFMKAYTKRFGEEKMLQEQAKEIPDILKVKYTQDMCLTGVGLKPKFGAHSAAIDSQNCLTLYQFLMSQGLNYARVIENVPHEVRGIAGAKGDLPEMYDF